MKVGLLTAGTRGDVEPFIALALALRAKGAPVLIAAPPELRELVESFGVPFRPIRADYLSAISTIKGRAATRGNPVAGWQLYRELVLPGVAAMLRDAADALSGVDALVFHPKALAGRHLVEAWKVPGWVVATAPLLVQTDDFPAPSTVHRNLGPLNRLTYALPGLAETAVRAEIRSWRLDLGLPQIPARGVRMAGTRRLPVLHAHSRFLVPTPRDWDADCHVTGFWTVPPASRASLGLPLVDFLDSGPEPIVVGFGAMTGPDAAATAQVAVTAARALRRRVVLVGLPEVTGSDVISVGNVPFRRLFPRAVATIHHGGAGTTAASLIAGKPTVLVPHGLDQPFWAERVRQAGVGASVPERSLTALRLVEALRVALRKDVAQRAERMAEAMRTEKGAVAAAELILRDA